MILTPFDGKYMIDMLPPLEMLKETLDLCRVGVAHHSDRAYQLQRRELSITLGHPIANMTRASSRKRNIANFLDG